MSRVRINEGWQTAAFLGLVSEAAREALTTGHTGGTIQISQNEATGAITVGFGCGTGSGASYWKLTREGYKQISATEALLGEG